MVTLFVVSVAFSILFSSTCSLMEAALYAVPTPYARTLASAGSRRGKQLLEFKEKIGKPIAGILILNTTANTAGASIAGWAAGEAFGAEALVPFSVIFTLVILLFCEILPKKIGVSYCKAVAPLAVDVIRAIVFAVGPLIYLSELLSRWISPISGPSMSLQEIIAVAETGTQEGALDQFEGSVISNVIGLDDKLVRDVLTPRVVVFRKPLQLALNEVEKELSEWVYTRIPLFSEEHPEMLTHYATQRDVCRALLSKKLPIADGREEEVGKVTKSIKDAIRKDPSTSIPVPSIKPTSLTTETSATLLPSTHSEMLTLADVARPLATIPELMKVDQALLTMLETREQMCAVVDEHGSLAGIITLEDIIEEIIGREIVDEYDTVSDMRTFAKLLQATKNSRRARPTNV
jgi:CBS domain containing-hemolysin-like protein